MTLRSISLPCWHWPLTHVMCLKYCWMQLTDRLHHLPLFFLSRSKKNNYKSPVQQKKCCDNMRVGFWTIYDVTNHACRPRLLKRDFQWAQRKFLLSAVNVNPTASASAHRSVTFNRRNKEVNTIWTGEGFNAWIYIFIRQELFDSFFNIERVFLTQNINPVNL